MNVFNQIFKEVYGHFFQDFPWGMFIFPLTAFVSLTFAKGLVSSSCGLHSSNRSSIARKRADEKSKNVKSKPIPCDIHNDCAECAFNGTSYCWKVMNYER